MYAKYAYTCAIFVTEILILNDNKRKCFLCIWYKIPDKKLNFSHCCVNAYQAYVCVAETELSLQEVIQILFAILQVNNIKYHYRYANGHGKLLYWYWFNCRIIIEIKHQCLDSTQYAPVECLTKIYKSRLQCFVSVSLIIPPQTKFGGI